MAPKTDRITDVVVIGAGPAGLMAAEQARDSGASVALYDSMATPGRKFLMAGLSGLNLTHSENAPAFLARYGESAGFMQPLLEAFSPAQTRAFAETLGQETFVGGSGRVFPRAMKTSPLLRAWVKRLTEKGVALHQRHRFLDFDAAGRLLLEGPDGSKQSIDARAKILALGGASWPRLGSNGAWTAILGAAGVNITSLTPANCGLHFRWSEVFRQRFEGAPIKTAAFSFEDQCVRGEAIVTASGLEGGPVYALSAAIARALRENRPATLAIDFKPDTPLEAIEARLAKRRAGDSLTNFLRKTLALSPAAIALAREAAARLPNDPAALAQAVKATRLSVGGIASIERAISSAGGVALSEIDKTLMLKKMPGVFVAGEMLDWDAPTGGYLLQACFATGFCAGTQAALFAQSRKAKAKKRPHNPLEDIKGV